MPAINGSGGDGLAGTETSGFFCAAGQSELDVESLVAVDVGRCAVLVQQPPTAFRAAGSLLGGGD